MDKYRALQCFDALSLETRLDVLRLLIQAGPEGLPAGEIGERLGVRQNTMSAHLSVLAQTGLLNSQREGRSIHYSAHYDALRGLIGFLMHDCCAGRSEICAPLLNPDTCC